MPVGKIKKNQYNQLYMLVTRPFYAGLDAGSGAGFAALVSAVPPTSVTCVRQRPSQSRRIAHILVTGRLPRGLSAGLRQTSGYNSEYLGVVGKGGSAPPLPNLIL